MNTFMDMQTEIDYRRDRIRSGVGAPRTRRVRRTWGRRPPATRPTSS